MNNLKINFGKRIKSIRQTKNLSQEELAEKIDIAVTNMGKIERGESFVTSTTLEKLSNALEVKVHELFKFDNFISLDEIKKELNLNKMSDTDIRKLYKFYKAFIDI